MMGGQESRCLHRSTKNGAWVSAIPHHLNGTDLSRGEFRDNLRLIYVLMPQEIPATCDGCGKKFSIDNSLSYPKRGLVLERHDNTVEEWGTLGARTLTLSAISY